MDGELSLQLPDSPFRGRKLRLLGRRNASLEAGVDSCLAEPVNDFETPVGWI